MTDSTPDNIRLRERHFGLLRDVIEKRAPQLLPVLREGSQVAIREDQREALMDLLSHEFAATGLREDYEPNERGLALEDLIDALRVRK